MTAGVCSLRAFSAATRSRRYGRDAKVVHFLGRVKPWNVAYDAQRGEVKGHSSPSDVYQLHPDYLLAWWQLYSKQVVPLLQRAYGDTPFTSGFVEQSEEVSPGLAGRVFERYTNVEGKKKNAACFWFDNNREKNVDLFQVLRDQTVAKNVSLCWHFPPARTCHDCPSPF